MLLQSIEALRFSGDVGPAIDVVGAAGDVGSVFAGEPDDQRSDVVGAALPPERNGSRQAGLILFIGRAGTDVGSYRTGAYRDAILRVSRSNRLIVTLGNHTVVGGLSEAVAATLAFGGITQRIVPIALPDEFLAAGALPTLHDRYGLSTDAVIARIKAELGNGTRLHHADWFEDPTPPSA